MARRYMALRTCVALCCFSWALTCTWMQSSDTQSNFHTLNLHAMSMLRELGGDIIRENRNSTLPYSLYDRAAELKAVERIAFIYETIHDMQKLFSTGEHQSVSWNPKKLEIFQLDLHRQASELKPCVKHLKLEELHFLMKITKKMRLHFRMLQSQLKSKKYSAQSWESVRAEVLTHLQRLDRVSEAGHNLTPK